jgi:hypothetical protein
MLRLLPLLPLLPLLLLLESLDDIIHIESARSILIKHIKLRQDLVNVLLLCPPKPH